MSAETFGATIKAYAYPPSFEECDGSAELIAGVSIGQQKRKAFGLTYQTVIGTMSIIMIMDINCILYMAH